MRVRGTKGCSREADKHEPEQFLENRARGLCLGLDLVLVLCFVALRPYTVRSFALSTFYLDLHSSTHSTTLSAPSANA